MITERDLNTMHIEAQVAVQKLLQDVLREFMGDRAEVGNATGEGSNEGSDRLAEGSQISGTSSS